MQEIIKRLTIAGAHDISTKETLTNVDSESGRRDIVTEVTYNIQVDNTHIGWVLDAIDEHLTGRYIEITHEKGLNTIICR